MLGTGEVAGPLRQRESVRALKALSTGPGEACAREQAGGNPCTGGAVIPDSKREIGVGPRPLFALPKSRLRLLKKADGGGFFLFSKGIVRV